MSFRREVLGDIKKTGAGRRFDINEGGGWDREGRLVLLSFFYLFVTISASSRLQGLTQYIFEVNNKAGLKEI